MNDLKLYVIAHDTGKKVFLRNYTAPDRKTLMADIGSNCFSMLGLVYTVNDVIAENEHRHEFYLGAITGGLVGLLMGPIGLILGFFLGGTIAELRYTEYYKQVIHFNQSTI